MKKMVEMVIKTLSKVRRGCFSLGKQPSHTHKKQKQIDMHSETIDKRNLKTYQKGKIEYQKLDR